MKEWQLVVGTLIAATLLIVLATIGSALWVASKRAKDPLAIWNHIQSAYVSLIWPGFGQWLFSWILGMANPFSKAMKIRFTTMRKGEVVGFVDEVSAIHNPFRSVHAAALILLAETVGGLAVFTTLDTRKGDRGIVGKIECEYFKKSRGRIVASATFERPHTSGKHISEVTLTDYTKTVVAKCFITWELSLGASAGSKME